MMNQFQVNDEPSHGVHVTHGVTCVVHGTFVVLVVWDVFADELTVTVC